MGFLSCSKERFINNKNPEFTDQEILTIYLFCVYEEQRFKVKEIYNWYYLTKIENMQFFGDKIYHDNDFSKIYTTKITQRCIKLKELKEKQRS